MAATDDTTRPKTSEVDPGYLLPGTKVGFYEVVARLGAGGFGAVYRVVRDGESYALKIANWNIAALQPQEVALQEQRIAREVGALQNLHHPNIVRVHALDKWPDMKGYPFFVMDFVDGWRFYDWVRRTRPTMRAICEKMARLALALQEIHRLEIYHRDLKSENLLIRKTDGEPILIDFGISRPKSAVTVTAAQVLLGTLSHLPPEYCAWYGSAAFKRGERFPFTPMTDLYAVGIMLFEALTNADPYPRGPDESEEDDDDFATIQRIKTVQPVAPDLLNPRIPPGLSRVVLKLLEKDPAARFQSGRELAEALSRAIGTTTEALGVPAASPGKQPERASSPTTPERRPKPSATSNGRLPKPAGTREVRDSQIVPADEARRSRSAARPTVLMTPAELPGPLDPAPDAREPQADDDELAALDSPPPDPDEQELPATFRRAGPSLAARSSTPRPAAPSQPTPSGTLGSQPVIAEPAFVEPSLQGQAGAFDPPEPPAAGSPAPGLEDPPAGAPESLERLLPRVAPGRPADGRSRSLRLVGLAGGVLLLLYGASFVGRRSESQVSLLERAERQAAEAPKPGQPPPAQPQVIDPMALPTHEQPRPVPSSPVATPPTTPPPAAPAVVQAPASRPGSPGAGVDAMLAQRYGRPTVGPDGTVGSGAPVGGTPAPASPADGAPAWLQRGTRADGAGLNPTAAAKPLASGNARSYGVGTGSHIRARLVTNLDSRTISSGPFEASLVRPFLVDGNPVFPSRTVLLGTASTNGDRFNLQIQRARLPDKTEVRFAGIGYDLAEKKPGIPSSRKIAAPPPEGESVGKQIAKGTATTMLNQVSGGLAQDLARSNGQIVVNSAGNGAAAPAADVLFLDSGVDFDVFVSEAF